MRQILWLVLLSLLPLQAGFFPKTLQTSVENTNGTTIQLHKPFPATGMSGIVIHNYGNSLEAITGYITQTSPQGEAVLVTKEIIHHEELPTIKTVISKGDKVIGGYLYNNVLLLAPDAKTYGKITSQYTKRWIHPDLFATFLSSEGEAYPTKENLARFAKAYQIGLIYIVKRNSAVLFDPISGKTVAQKSISSTTGKAQYPFFMRFDTFRTGIFSDSGEGDYYQTMEQFK
jgi:hypothetical protein